MKLVISIFLLFISFSFLKATTHIVTNLNNSGTGSLRLTISNASANDTIRFDPNLISNGTSTIILNSQISITVPVTIIGLYNQTDSLKISGNETNRAFVFSSVSGLTSLDSLIIFNCKASPPTTAVIYGGAIYYSGDSLKISNSYFNNNKIIGGASGSVYVNGNFQGDNVHFKNNSASYGGGSLSIETIGNSTIASCSFKNNYANQMGGALACGGSGRVEITNSNFDSNRCPGGSGGAISGGDSLILNCCVFRNNFAQQNGGAIRSNGYIFAENLKLTADTSNTASGGGIWCKNISIINSVFQDCFSAIIGGGIAINDVQTSTITNCDFNNNRSVNKGGAISSIATDTSFLNIDNCNFNNNYNSAISITENTELNLIKSSFFQNISGTSGGAIIISNINSTTLPIRITNCEFGQNSADNGGAIALSSSSAPNILMAIDSCTFHDNTSTVGGGAISFGTNSAKNANTLNIDHSFFQNNSSDYGGAIRTNGLINISNTDFTGNFATQDGGALRIQSSLSVGDTTDTELSLSNVNFQLNNCSKQGGAIYYETEGNNILIPKKSVLINNCTIENNSSLEEGGGIYLSTVSPITIENSKISFNTSSIDGGGMYARGKDSSYINKCTIEGNTASVLGGGFYIGGLYGFSKFHINNSTFNNNSSNNGGAIMDVANCKLTNSSFIENHSILDGGGYFSHNGGAYDSIYNCSFIGNISDQNSSTLGGTGNIYVSSSIFFDNSLGNSISHNVISLGNNIFSESTIAGSVPSDFLAIDSVGINLSHLRYNGSFTKTKMPLPSSICIDNGSPSDFRNAQNQSINDTRRDIGSTENTCNTFDVIDTIVCADNLISPSGAYTWVTSGNYTDTLNNMNGCDSILMYKVTFKKDRITKNITSCDSLVSPNQSQTYYTSGVYQDTLTNSYGCDSIVTTILTINNSNPQTLSVTACDSYVVPSGNSTYYTSGVIMDTTMTLSSCCESISTINLTINQSSYDTINVLNCAGLAYTSPSGLNTWNQSGNYQEVFINSSGCDSTITYKVIIDPIINTQVTRLNQLLISQQTANGTSYQWLNCSNSMLPANNGISQQYTSASDSSYAVVLTSAWGCKDTSECIKLTNNSLFFDGIDDQVDLGNMTVNNEFTIETWINPSSWSSNGDLSTIIESGSGFDVSFIVEAGNNGMINFAIGDGISKVDLLTPANTLELNEWQHLATTFDNGLMKVFVNGSIIDSLNTTIVSSTSFQAVFLGNSDSFSKNYHGKIDELRIWDIARSALELNEFMNSEICTPSTNLLKDYRFNQGSANGNNLNTNINTTSKLFNQVYNTYTGSALQNFSLIGNNSNFVEGVEILGSNITTTINEITCESYTSPSSNYIWSSSGIHYDTVINGCGLPSYYVVDLTISIIDTSITRLAADSIKANENLADYQWINCLDSLPLSGQTNQYLSNIANGNYAVIITKNNCYDTSECFTITNCNVESNFSYLNNGNGNIDFTNLSTGQNLKYDWQFGNGTTSNQQSPTILYPSDGNYNIVLGITDSTFSNMCFDYSIQNMNISGVLNPVDCNAGFVTIPDSTTNNLLGYNSSTGTNLSYFWDFGDGNTSTLSNPVHTYNTNGPFNLCLSIAGQNGCSNTYCDSVGPQGSLIRSSGFTINIQNLNETSGVSHKELSDILITPNPVNDFISFTNLKSSINHAVLLDINGKIIEEMILTNSKIFVGNLSKGCYFLRINTDFGPQIFKFIKS